MTEYEDEWADRREQQAQAQIKCFGYETFHSPVVGTTAKAQPSAGPRKVLGFGSVLLAPPHYSFGRKLWAPANGLGDALIALLNVAATQERENFSVEHLEHLTALGFYCEVVLPGMDTGVEWEVTK